mgnify:FL=1
MTLIVWFWQQIHRGSSGSLHTGSNVCNIIGGRGRDDAMHATWGAILYGWSFSIHKKMVWTSYGSSYVRMLKAKVMVPSCILVSFLMPSLMVPITTHPLMRWGLSLFGSLSLLMATSYALDLHFFPLVTPWLLIFGSLLFVMASSYYKNGILRAFVIVGYIGFSTPMLWWSLKVTMGKANKKSLIKSEAIPLKKDLLILL